jgi:hypothetical protein
MKDISLNLGDKEYNSVINDIIIEITIYDRKEKRKELNISELMLELKLVVDKLEDNLSAFCADRNLILNDWSKRKDILIKFKP